MKLENNDVMYRSSSKTMTDYVTAQYRKKIENGAIVNSPCYFSSESTESIFGSVTGYYGSESKPITFSGPVTIRFCDPNVLPGMVDRPSVNEDSVRLKALSRIDKSEFSFGEDLGEIGQTLRFLKNPLRSLTDLTKKHYRHKKALERSYLKSGQYSKTKALVKASADAYATYQWAYKPLVRSAEDLTKAVFQYAKATQKRYTSRAHEKLDYSEKGVYSVGGTAAFACDYTNRELLDFRAAILYETSRKDSTFLKKYGLRFKDAPETAWQLFPLSFMVDRVANISDVIRATQNLFDSDINILAGSVTTRHLQSTSLSATMARYFGIYMYGNGGEHTISSFTYTRDPWTPSSSDLIPPITMGRLVKDVSSILDLTALIIQRIT